MLRSRLFQAIAFSLVIGATASSPVVAGETSSASTAANAEKCIGLSRIENSECRQPAFGDHGLRQTIDQRVASAHSLANAGNGNNAPGNVAPAAYEEAGVIGDAQSWVNDEFNLDWGLAAINAHHAYARGLTGSGVRLGIMDSGVDLRHEEFAGKNHQGLTIGDLLDDGTRCAPDRFVSGPDACFGTDGGRASIDAQRADPSLGNGILEPDDPRLGRVRYSLQWHGTHVGGTMVANRDGNGMHGVAFGADLSSARLFADSLTNLDLLCLLINRCTTESTQANHTAFEDMYNQMSGSGVRAINHSWGLTYQVNTGEQIDADYQWIFNPDETSPTAVRLRNQYNAMAAGSINTGMIQVWAAGNNRQYVNPTPAEAPMAGLEAALPRWFGEDLEKYWLTVVNVARTGDDNTPYALSNRSMKCGVSMNWCLAAPGTDIASSIVQNSTTGYVGNTEVDANGNKSLSGLDTITYEYGYGSVSGTSMAAPHVTGALGLLFERFPYLTSYQVRDILLTTATDLGEEGVDEIYGWGLVNLQKAIEGYGQFRVNTDVAMVAKAGGAHIWNDARVWDVWTNDIGGPGHFSFTSPNGGWLRLSGSNSFNGLTVKGGTLELTGANTLTSNVTVDGGLLLVNGDGTLNNTVQVNAGGTLGGTGTVNGHVTVAGTMAPGASIGTLTINGNYVQQAGSYFNVEMQPPSATDKLVVNGTATLDGGTVRAIRMPGVYMLGQSYNFLTASGGITGTFAGVDVSGLSPFLDMRLVYTANDVSANMVRGMSLSSAGVTHNQIQTGAGLDALPDSNALLQSLVLLPDVASANRAFDQLSGEMHSTARGVLADDSRHVRNAALARARTGHDIFTGQSAAPGFAAWAELLGSSGTLQGNDNAAYTRYSGHHALVGGDYQFDGGFRVGVLGGVGRTDANIGKRDSKAEIRNRMVGVYGGQRFAGFGVHAGFVHATHDIDGVRKVAFTGFADDLQSKYDGTTRQAFVELGYEFGADAWQIEPYLQYANVQVKTNAFSENGGLAALSVGNETNKLDVATAGLRFGVNLKGSQQEQTWLSLRGGLGYRQASGDVANASTMSFAGGTGFNVQGAPLAKKATVGELGIAARITERTLLELGYSGQFADEGNDHGANARLSIKF